MYESVPLTEKHNVERFSCGVVQLDEWLSSYAKHAAVMNTARTFVWVQPDSVVVGYYSLAGHQVAREALPRGVARGSPLQIPAVLIGKLALDSALQGHERRFGGELLVDALRRVLKATQLVAARLVVVDAINDNALSFYEHFGFVRTAPDSYRLVRKISDIAADLAGLDD